MRIIMFSYFEVVDILRSICIFVGKINRGLNKGECQRFKDCVHRYILHAFKSLTLTRIEQYMYIPRPVSQKRCEFRDSKCQKFESLTFRIFETHPTEGGRLDLSALLTETGAIIHFAYFALLRRLFVCKRNLFG